MSIIVPMAHSTDRTRKTRALVAAEQQRDAAERARATLQEDVGRLRAGGARSLSGPWADRPGASNVPDIIYDATDVKQRWRSVNGAWQFVGLIERVIGVDGVTVTVLVDPPPPARPDRRHEATITADIIAVEKKLAALYHERRGRLVDGDPARAGWCGACGRNQVDAMDGKDTCMDCLVNQ